MKNYSISFTESKYLVLRLANSLFFFLRVVTCLKSLQLSSLSGFIENSDFW